MNVWSDIPEIIFVDHLWEQREREDNYHSDYIEYEDCYDDYYPEVAKKKYKEKNVSVAQEITNDKIILFNCYDRESHYNDNIYPIYSIYGTDSKIVCNLTNLVWINLISPYIERRSMLSLSCCCKQLNVYISKNKSAIKTLIPVQINKLDYYEYFCMYCGISIDYLEDKRMMYCDECKECYQVPVRIGSELIISKSEVFSNGKPRIVPDYYVSHLKNIITDVYAYWKLAIKCVHLVINKEIHSQKPCHKKGCVDQKVGHLVNFRHQKKLCID